LGKVLDTVIRLEAPDVTGFFQNFLYLFAVMRLAGIAYTCKPV